MEPSDDLPDLRHIDKHVRLLVRTYARRENLYLLESLIHRIKIQKMMKKRSKNDFHCFEGDVLRLRCMRTALPHVLHRNA